MPERGHLRASEGQDVRSERPAMGYGSPEAVLGELTHHPLPEPVEDFSNSRLALPARLAQTLQTVPAEVGRFVKLVGLARLAWGPRVFFGTCTNWRAECTGREFRTTPLRRTHSCTRPR